MLNVSVPTRLPFIKMPKLPESATLALLFPLSLVWSAALRPMDVARVALRRMASFTAFTFLPPIILCCLLLFFCFFQQMFDFRRDLLYRFAERLNRESCQSVICATRGKQLIKPCVLLCQRTRFLLRLAAPPQFFQRSFQQNGDCAGGVQRITILLLHKRPAAQR